MPNQRLTQASLREGSLYVVLSLYAASTVFFYFCDARLAAQLIVAGDENLSHVVWDNDTWCSSLPRLLDTKLLVEERIDSLTKLMVRMLIVVIHIFFIFLFSLLTTSLSVSLSLSLSIIFLIFLSL